MPMLCNDITSIKDNANVLKSVIKSNLITRVN